MSEALLNERLCELAAAGVICAEIAEQRPLEIFEPIVASGSNLSETVIEDREDRV